MDSGHDDGGCKYAPRAMKRIDWQKRMQHFKRVKAKAEDELENLTRSGTDPRSRGMLSDMKAGALGS